jgi:hypothetical protein
VDLAVEDRVEEIGLFSRGSNIPGVRTAAVFRLVLAALVASKGSPTRVAIPSFIVSSNSARTRSEAGDE